MSGTKYQISISSTYLDLKDERDRVTKAVLEMGNIPVGMEMFSAADDEQWKIIQHHIDESDYYVLILAHRYGSTLDNGISYTEREYDYAIEKKIPVLGFVIDDKVKWEPGLIETDKKAELDNFKAKIRKKLVKSWKSAEDLQGLVAIALGKQITARPMPGWIRGTSAVSAEVLAEMSRLSAENSALRDAMKIPSQPDLVFHIQAALMQFDHDDDGIAFVILQTDLLVTNRTGEPVSLPLDFIEIQSSYQDKVFQLKTEEFFGLEDDKLGNKSQILVTKPRTVYLKSSARNFPNSMEESGSFEITYRFEALGFAGPYNFKVNLQNKGNCMWTFPESLGE